MTEADAEAILGNGGELRSENARGQQQHPGPLDEAPCEGLYAFSSQVADEADAAPVRLAPREPILKILEEIVQGIVGWPRRWLGFSTV